MSTRPTPKLALILALAALVFLGGCATNPRGTGAYSGIAEAPPYPGEEEPMSGEAAVLAAEAEMEDAAAAAAANGSAEDPARSVRRGTGKFLNEDVAKRAPAGAGASGEVTFNFEGESLHAVVKAILGDFLQQNYVIAPGVQGTVTFSTAKPLRGDQALSILEMLLRWNNATLVWQDGRYTILPVAQALPGNLTPRIGSARNARGYEVRAVPLQYISALEMEKLLKPYAKPEGIVTVDAARNMVVLAGTRAELENYLQTIATFDVDWLAGMSVGVFPLQQAEAGKTVTDLEKIFGEGSNTPLAGMFRFMPLDGINAVMVITSQPNYMGQIEEWLERLDMGGGEAGQRLYVYDVKNVKAVDLAATLGEIFGDSGSSVVRAPSASGDALMPGLEPVEIRTVGTGADVSPSSGANDPKGNDNAATSGGNAGNDNRSPGGDGGPAVDQSGGIALGASDEVRISASEENNALLVKATSGQWESIRRVIERLDTIPLQVHIEAQIVRVTLNDALNYGVQWYFENGIPDAGLRARAGDRDIWGDLGGSFGPGTDSGGGLSWTFLGPNAQAIITALDSVSDATVLSAPSLVVLNNKTANINVGTQLPVVSSFFGGGVGGQDPNTNPNVNQSYVQFRQTGITLDVTPRVNPGGLVFMEVDQTESAPVAGPTVGGNAPVDNRSIKTEVAVQSGQTLVLGGLIKTTHSSERSGVPGLSRIPFIGGLFGTQGRESTREELLVLITPRVIRNEQEAQRLTEEYSRRFRGIQPLRVFIEPQPRNPAGDRR